MLLLIVAQSSAWIFMLHVYGRIKMQKHSLGPQSPVKRERHNQNVKVG